MEVIEANFGKWDIQCFPEDGARISVLRYEGQDLLTANPPSFKAPDKFHGKYETRPVYGYDDCFPTVDPCLSEDGDFEYNDHGELCWVRWQVQVEKNTLICSTDCSNPKATFKRILEFAENKLTWRFEVINTSGKKLSFLHVMHPLLPLENINSISIPEFSECRDEANCINLKLKNAAQVTEHLLTMPSGSYEMLHLSKINSGTVVLGFQKDFFLWINFDNILFPTLGIWWNNNGYPEEEGIKRCECAFEPIPGVCSNLEKSIRENSFLELESGENIQWKINWKIEKR